MRHKPRDTTVQRRQRLASDLWPTAVVCRQLPKRASREVEVDGTKDASVVEVVQSAQR